MIDPIAAMIVSGAAAIALQGTAAYDRCTLYEKGAYGWQIEARGGRLTLTAEDQPGFNVIATDENYDTTGEFEVTLVSEGGRREIRIAPPDVLYNGIPMIGEWDEIDLVIAVAGNEVFVPGPPRPFYAVGEGSIHLVDVNRYTRVPQRGVDLSLFYNGEEIVRGSIKAFLLGAGMEEWDRAATELRDAGCRV
ncbi:hypothetical protein [Aquisalinus flavus]|uniref:Uncharacterized protein n=1 Tax=Aquisalinus flavus TaxID=1526572 RepID=A0A8J2V5R3_9PROT|nr:hypothetical protein [Aquisalinus flavus]MBD0425553.1 hypothetical protein [Aquisalinus flavus]UNE48821.1 hypothetical protein FF099_12560 [Aquisalinus flavus]GGD15171.1 hypothetical protein GCM10011342_24900 [Aquisalinus flavus]